MLFAAGQESALARSGRCQPSDVGPLLEVHLRAAYPPSLLKLTLNGHGHGRLAVCCPEGIAVQSIAAWLASPRPVL
jgi:hypothetical protein